MEKFRTRFATAGQERKLLVPLSMGVSSLALLHCLDEQLKRQIENTGRTGFALQVLHVDMTAVVPEGPSAADLDAIKQRYPTHTYTTIPISSVMEVEDIQDLLKQYKIDTPAVTANPQNTGIETTNLQSLQTLLQAIPTATARADVLQILLHNLIVSFAKADACEAILWGDSTTRLAEKTLAETAKGRGFALAWLVSDGPSPYEIDFYYPLRDLLKKEIHAYATYTSPPLTPLVAPEAPLETVVSAKHSTIDGLMRNYFDAVEKNYPSIVANVVRTTAKFVAPGVGVGDASCSLCGLPLLLTPRTEEGLVKEGKAPPPLCYGCMRSVPIFSP
jgi:cytoplasmic tRNA 2-thiolation protein 2